MVDSSFARSRFTQRPPMTDAVMQDIGETEFLERRGRDNRTEAAVREIDRLDLTPIIRKLCRPVSERGMGWSRGRAEEAAKWYKRFLKLCLLQDEKVVPPADVDELWHVHILHTKKYHEDCQRIFQRYLHHSPSDGTEDGKLRMEDLFQSTLSRFERLFGERPLEGKHSGRADCHCNGHCCGNDK